MITDKRLDEALVELLRCKKALEALRRTRKVARGVKICDNGNCMMVVPVEAVSCEHCNGSAFYGSYRADIREHAAAKRASLDVTRKLADLRAGR